MARVRPRLCRIKRDTPIRVWSDQIDDKVIVGCACAHRVYLGGLYGTSVFVLVAIPQGATGWRAKYDARSIAEQKLRAAVASENGSLPFIEYVGTSYDWS